MPVFGLKPASLLFCAQRITFCGVAWVRRINQNLLAAFVFAVLSSSIFFHFIAEKFFKFERELFVLPFVGYWAL